MIGERLRRPRSLLLAVVLGLGVVVPGVALTPPASALTCTYDAFYAFQPNDQQPWLTYITGSNGLPGALTLNQGDGQYTSFCQLNTGYNPGVPGAPGPWSEWVEKGTSECLTYVAAGEYARVIQCQDLVSQNWELYTNLGSCGTGCTAWEGMANAYQLGTTWWDLANYYGVPGSSTTTISSQLAGQPNFDPALSFWDLVYEGT
jgi:hypothetical protein